MAKVKYVHKLKSHFKMISMEELSLEVMDGVWAKEHWDSLPPGGLKE